MYQAGQLLWWSRRHSPLFTRNSSPGTLSPDYPHALHSWPTIPSSATLRHWLGLSRALSLSQSQFHVITVNLRREVIMQFLCRRDPARPDQTKAQPDCMVCLCVGDDMCWIPQYNKTGATVDDARKEGWQTRRRVA